MPSNAVRRLAEPARPALTVRAARALDRALAGRGAAERPEASRAVLEAAQRVAASAGSRRVSTHDIDLALRGLPAAGAVAPDVAAIGAAAPASTTVRGEPAKRSWTRLTRPAEPHEIARARRERRLALLRQVGTVGAMCGVAGLVVALGASVDVGTLSRRALTRAARLVTSLDTVSTRPDAVAAATGPRFKTLGEEPGHPAIVAAVQPGVSFKTVTVGPPDQPAALPPAVPEPAPVLVAIVTPPPTMEAPSETDPLVGSAASLPDVPVEPPVPAASSLFLAALPGGAPKVTEDSGSASLATPTSNALLPDAAPAPVIASIELAAPAPVAPAPVVSLPVLALARPSEPAVAPVAAAAGARVAAPAVAPAVMPAPSTQPANPEEAARLLKLAKALVAIGQTSDARAMVLAAADTGSPEAIAALKELDAPAPAPVAPRAQRAAKRH